MAARVAAVIVLLSVVVSGLVIGTLLQPGARPCPAASQSSSPPISSSRAAEARALSEVAASAAALPAPGAAGRCGAYVGR
jgi:hypothetical protein